jgi:hypothetical protein
MKSTLRHLGNYGRASTLESAWRILFFNFFLNKGPITSSVCTVFDAVDEAFEEERLNFLDLAKDILSATNRGRMQQTYEE